MKISAWDKANKITKAVCKYYEFKSREEIQLFSDRKNSKFVRARYIIMYLMRNSNYPNIEIAIFVSKDHSTITTGLKRAEERYMDDIKNIKRMLEGK